MSIQKIKSVLLEIEELYPEVHQWSHDGIDLWPVVRTEYFLRVSAEQSNVKNPASRNTWSLLKQFASTWTQFGSWRSLMKADSHSDIVALLDNSFVKIDSKWYHQWADPLLTQLSKKGLKTLSLDVMPKALLPHTNDRGINIAFQIFIVRFISKHFNSKSVNLYLPHIDKINKYLTDQNMPIIMGDPDVLKEAQKIKGLSIYFQKILRKRNTKLGLVVSYYSNIGYAYVNACHAEGIPVVDIQHGVQGEYHLAYSHWTKDTTYNTVPSHFWCWSTDSIKSITSERVIAGGHPFAHFWTQKIKPTLERSGLSQKKKQILLTLQIDNTAKIYGELFRLAKSTQDQYNWIIRLHPTVLKNEVELEKNLTLLKHFQLDIQAIKKQSAEPLFNQLATTDVHITFNSSVIIEASYFGIKSIVVDEEGYEYYRGQGLEESMNLVLSSQDIIKSLKDSQDSSSNYKKPLSLGDNFTKAISLLKALAKQ